MKLEALFSQQVAQLSAVLDESHYLSREGLNWISREIHVLTDQFYEGTLSFPDVEKTLAQLNKKAASDEISTLLTKLKHVNPTSPRLDKLKRIAERLLIDEISPEQARQDLQNLMHPRNSD